MKRFPTVLLCLVLVFALLVSAVGWPAWLIPLITPAEKTAPVVLPEGESEAFEIKPVDGITISAGENALDKDREFKLEAVSGDEYEELSENYWEAVDSPGIVVGAWELDAGLADDEMLPGYFTMDFDLETLGIEEEDYEAVKIYRVDDSGTWYEYATSLDGSVLTVESSQNSVIIAVIGWTLIASSPKLLSMWQAYTGGAYLNPFTGCFDVHVPDKGGPAVMEIMLDRSSFIDVLDSGNQKRYGEMDVKAKDAALKRVIKENDLFEDTTMKDLNEMPFIKKDFLKYYKQNIKKYLDEDPDYQRIQANIDQYKTEIPQLRDELEQVQKVKEMAQKAWPYLASLGLKMPKYKLRLELSGENRGSYGVTITPYWGNPYLVIFMEMLGGGTKQSYDQLLLTMCHEMFHAIQRGYVMDSRANYKFDELSAMALEMEAYDHFVETGDITSGKEESLSNLTDAYYFALPLDSFSTTYPEGKLSASDKAGASYPIAPFFSYLKSEKPYSYPTILTRYKGLWGKRALTTILKEAFSVSEQELTDYYFEFAESYGATFYKQALLSNVNPLFAPEADISSGKLEVSLLNKSYTTRVRRIAVKPVSEKDKEYAIVLKKLPEYDEVMTDFKMTPLKMEEGKGYREWSGGLFFDAKAYASRDKQYAVYLMEVDGGTGDNSEGYFTNDYGKYVLYQLPTPAQPEKEVKGNILSITLPDLSKAPRAEVLDSMTVTLRVGKTEVFSERVVKEKWAEPFKIELDKLRIDGKELTAAQRKELAVVIRECVEGTFESSAPCFGPESEPLKIFDELDIVGKWDVESTLEGFDMEMLRGIIAYMPKEMRDYYTDMLDSMAGQQGHGIMTVEAADGETYKVVFVYDKAKDHPAEYTGVFDKKAMTLSITPVGLVLTNPMILKIEESGDTLTCSGTTDYSSDIVTYNMSINGTKIE